MGTLCHKCGNDNDLGRVFCTRCGVKLDLSAVTSDRLAEVARPPWILRNAKWLILGAASILVLILVLAFWPASPLAKDATRRDGRAAEQKLGLLNQRYKMNESLTVNISEEEANGYLMLRKQKAGVTSATIAFGQDSFLLRIIDKHGPWKLGPVRISPTYSWEIGGTVVAGQIWVRRASVGHLRLFGPAKKGRAQKALAFFKNDEQDRELFPKLTSVKFEEDRMILTVGNE